ncbi:hypothetical protein [Bacillus sp. AK128]
MRLRKTRLCLFFFILFVISGCSSDELSQLREERDQLRSKINLLEKENKQLRKEASQVPSNQDMLTFTYLDIKESHRFIPKEVPLLILPNKESQQLNQIQPNTVVEVHDFVDVNGEVWLHVTIPVFDTPINMKGWIKEIDTQLYTTEIQDLVSQPIFLKKGTPVYQFGLFNELQAVEPVEIDMDQNCFVSDRQDDFLALGCAGGTSYIVSKEFVVFPEVK